MNTQLSKSEYMMFLKHPAWLWLKKHDKSKLPETDANLQALFDDGNLFEEYVEKLFPDGVTLGYKTDGEFDGSKYSNLPKVTKKAIEDKTRVLFQGRLEIDGITCIFDILEHNDDGTYNLYEIKSSTKVKPEHEYDLAFQVVVLELSGLTIRNISVIHVNNQYVRDGDINIKELTATTDITDKVRGIMEFTKENILKAHGVVSQVEIPDISPRHTSFRSLSQWLTIYKKIKGDIGKYSIYNLSSPSAKTIGELEDLNIESIAEIPLDFKLNKKQQLQAEATKAGEQIIERDEIKEFINNLEFPIHFFDYETFSGVIPAFNGIHPYQQVPFQYSLHILEDPNSKLIHKEYLHAEASNPTLTLIEQMQKDFKGKGSIIVWYERFEKDRNKEMALMHPKYEDFLLGLNARIVDLMIPFSEGWFVDKDFLGSASLKAVLPVLVPELSYKDLDISNGELARRIWMETILEGKNTDTKDKIMNDLIKYCKLDTLALVEILKILNIINV